MPTAALSQSQRSTAPQTQMPGGKRTAGLRRRSSGLPAGRPRKPAAMQQGLKSSIHQNMEADRTLQR